MNPEKKIYTQREIAVVVGLEPKIFQDYVTRGIFPNAPETSGTGDWRRYSVTDAIFFSLLVPFLKGGIRPQSIRDLAPLVDLARTTFDEHEYVVVRRIGGHVAGSLAIEDGLTWIGDPDEDGYEAAACSTDQLAQAVAAAGEFGFILRAGEIERRVINQVEKMEHDRAN